MLSIKQGGIQYIFCVFGITRPRIEPWPPGPLVDTVIIMPVGRSGVGVVYNDNHKVWY